VKKAAGIAYAALIVGFQPGAGVWAAAEAGCGRDGECASGGKPLSTEDVRNGRDRISEDVTLPVLTLVK
jgi:hypothetical protein